MRVQSIAGRDVSASTGNTIHCYRLFSLTFTSTFWYIHVPTSIRHAPGIITLFLESDLRAHGREARPRYLSQEDHRQHVATRWC
jgi:hypothetical protein